MAVALVVGASCIAYVVGLNSGERRATAAERSQGDWNGSKAQTADAIRRWKRKTSPGEMEGRNPYTMAFPDRNCIELKLEPGIAGGEPIYCYRANSLILVEEHSDLE